MDVSYNGANRMMHQEHFSRVYHGGPPGVPPRGDSIRNFGPESGVHIVDAQQYGNAEREHFLHRNHGMLVNRNEHSVDEGQRFLNGGSHIPGVANTPSKGVDWTGSTQTGEMEEEVDNRDVEERDGGSTGGSGTDGSEEDEEEDGDINGGGENIVSHRGVTRLVDRGIASQRGYEGLPTIQMDNGNRHEALGLQRSKHHRESSSQGVTSAPSLGMFLSQTSTMPFLNSFSSVGPVFGHGESGPTVANGTLVANELDNSSGYTREAIEKETNNRDTFVKESQNYSHEQSRISCSSPEPEAVQVGVESAEDDSTLVQPSAVTPLNDPGNQIVAFSQRKNPDALGMLLRSTLTDPLTGTLMGDATILSCGHSFGSESLQRIIENNACISCGAAAKREDMAPNHALQCVVRAFRREKEHGKENISKAAKRRRDRIYQGESSRLRGVKFPYKVNDKVLIKGNKRTPERFVGHSAVITTQCLNGWYVVRTLDNGESVKLQYRSLMKADEQPSPSESQAKLTGPNWL